MGLALQTRAAGFGSGRRRGGLQSPSGSLRVADPSGAAVAVRARGSKPVAPLRAKKSFGGTAPSSPLCFLHYIHILWSDWRDSAFFVFLVVFFYSVCCEFGSLSSNQCYWAMFGFVIFVDFHGIDV